MSGGDKAVAPVLKASHAEPRRAGDALQPTLLTSLRLSDAPNARRYVVGQNNPSVCRVIVIMRQHFADSESAHN